MTTEKVSKYFEAVGRRKTAIARVRITPAKDAKYDVNGKSVEAYFPTKDIQLMAIESFKKSGIEQKFHVTVKLIGGGVSSQAGALRHGLARALTVYDAELRGKLKKAGFLKRDARAKERRKFGLKKARKAPQWAKR